MEGELDATPGTEEGSTSLGTPPSPVDALSPQPESPAPPAARPESLPAAQPSAPAPAPGEVPAPPWVYGPPPAPAPARAARSLWLVIGIIAVVLIAGLGGGAVFANVTLSSLYSPQRAVTDYFAAMGRGDVAGMVSNATFMPGNSADAQLNDRISAEAMVAVDQNRQITGLSVLSTRTVDSSTSSVTVSLDWGGTHRDLAYTVRKDTSRVHYLFYDSWRVEVPSATISITLPNQPGMVKVDGILLPPKSATRADVIQGFHEVTMLGNYFYDQSTQVADAVEGTAGVTFNGTLSAATMAAAVTAVKKSFANVTCDANTYFDCPNHQYTVQAGFYDTLSFPGGDIRANSGWSLAFDGDPTAGMKLVVTAEPGKITASGTCALTLTVDGSQTYNFRGTWTGTLTITSNGAFNSDVIESCASTRA